MDMILQKYDDGTWGYKGIDDRGKNIIAGRKVNEDVLQFFERIHDCPSQNHYGRIPRLDLKVHGDVEDRKSVAYLGYAHEVLVYDRNRDVRLAVAKTAGEIGLRSSKRILNILKNDIDNDVAEMARKNLKLL